MPIPLLAGAVIGAGSSLIGGQQNNDAQQQQNFDSQRFSREMYERQKTDNIAFWNMQNEYNSPQAQMNRLQAAGLNPHLVYGNGASGNNAGGISSPSIQSPEFRSGQPGTGTQNAGLAFMNAIYDLDIKQAQADNLKAQNTVYQQDALLKAAQIQDTTNRAKLGEFDLGYKSEFRPYSAEVLKEQARQGRIQNDISLTKEAREAAMGAASLSETIERTLNLRVQRGQSQAETARIRKNIELMKQDGTLKELEIKLRKKGINPNDPTYIQVAARLADDIIGGDGSLKSMGTNIWKWILGN